VQTYTKGLGGAAVHVAALAVHDLNGRQIKNALQLGMALARRDGIPLTQSHLEATLELTTAFAHDAVRGAQKPALGQPQGRPQLPRPWPGLACLARCLSQA